MNAPLVSAHYLAGHKFLNCQDQLINFGGKYLYTLKTPGKQLIFSAISNPSFQEDFFDISESKIALSNISAIVGQNGVGKSSVLDTIRKHFIEKPAGLVESDSVILIEDGKTVRFSSNIEGITVSLQIGRESIPLEPLSKGDIQTIYYSPHFDLHYQADVDEVDYHDISLDRSLEADLVDLPNRGKNTYGLDYPVKQELRFINSKRQLQFLSSQLVTKKKIFNGLIDFPNHGKAAFITRETLYDKNLKDSPAAFVTPVKNLLKQINTDLDNFTASQPKGKNGRYVDRIQVSKYLLKGNIIKNLLSVMIRQMDAKGENYDQGKFDLAYFEHHRGTSCEQGFIAFLLSCKLPSKNGDIEPFNVKLIKAFLTKIQDVLYSIGLEDDVSDISFLTDARSAEELLEIQNQVIWDISNYYNKQWATDSTDFERLNYLVPGVLLYSPAGKALSSGENALLNFFSKLYDFLSQQLRPDVHPERRVKTYLLLLDEADLGFHPLWKKKYIYLLSQTLGYFFEQYPNLKSIQLIFTTHDPLTLSDLPNNNVIYIRKTDGKLDILDYQDRRPTFAANITDLLADSFFMDEGLIGNFAQHKIDEIVEWLNGKTTKNAAKHKQTIEMIDEPIIRQKLAEMYDEKMGEDLELSLIDKQLQALNDRKEQLKNDRNPNQ